MEIEIRRNLDLNFKFEVDEKTQKSLLDLAEQLKPTPEQQKELDLARQQLREIEEKIWKDIESKSPVYDLLGNPITRETHEICYDMEYETRADGLSWGYAKCIYIRPKKSEYDKK